MESMREEKTFRHTLPADIERTSMEIITRELAERGITVPEENLAVVRRVIHTTADFDYAENLRFSDHAVMRGIRAMTRGRVIITDTNMALAGISRPTLEKLGVEARCFMADPKVAQMAKKKSMTRASASMIFAAEHYPGAVFAVGNAPTALIRLCEQIEAGFRPSLVAAVPVGFVNVVESKEQLFHTCLKYDVPVICAMGRKGGSTVACAIMNALLYSAAGTLDPTARGWR